MTEHNANAELARAAARIEWEDRHMGAWMAPAPQRAPRRSAAPDYVIAAMLACVIVALILGVL